MARLSPVLVGLLVVMVVASVNGARFLHLTDVHYESEYTTSSDVSTGCYLPLASNSSDGAPPVGSFSCDSSPLLLTKAFSSIASLHNHTSFDFVLWTGDTSPHSPTPSSIDDVVNNIAVVGGMLKTALPNVTAYYALGNHDWFPVYDVVPNSGYYLNIWQQLNQLGWLPAETNATFSIGGYYTVLLAPQLRLVSLNTALYITKNNLTVDMQDPADQISWLNQTLADARHNNETVYIIGHAAPGMNEKQNVSLLWPQFNVPLLNVFATYSDVITAHFYGHEHSDAIRFSYNTTANEYNHSVNAHNMQPTATGIMFIAPSLTPWTNTTMFPWIPLHNPAFRTVDIELLHNASQAFGSILDIQTYWLDLNAANQNPNATEFELEYTFKNDLKTGDVADVNSLWNVFSSLRRNNASLTAYLKRNSVQAFTNCSWKGHEDCRKVQLCAISDPTLDGFLSCLQHAGYSPARYIWGLIIGGAVFLAILTLMAVTCTILSMVRRTHGSDEERTRLVR